MLCNRLSLTWSYLVLASLATIPTMVIRAVLISSVHKTNCISPQEVDILEYELLGLFISTLLIFLRPRAAPDMFQGKVSHFFKYVPILSVAVIFEAGTVASRTRHSSQVDNQPQTPNKRALNPDFLVGGPWVVLALSVFILLLDVLQFVHLTFFCPTKLEELSANMGHNAFRTSPVSPIGSSHNEPPVALTRLDRYTHHTPRINSRTTFLQAHAERPALSFGNGSRSLGTPSAGRADVESHTNSLDLSTSTA